MLEVIGLRKRYGEIAANDGVSFKLERGKISVLIGPNASGKTTLMKSIAGLIDPDLGAIVVDGRVVFERSPSSSRPTVNIPPHARNVGYLPSEPSLFPHLTLRENLELPLRKRRWSRGDIERRIREVIEIASLEGYESYYPHQLSSGLRQKASIARILTYEPSVVLLDEPLSSIDKVTRERLRREMSELFGRTEAAVLISTHMLEDVVFFKDRVLAILNGRIIYDGELSEEKVASNQYMLDLFEFIKIPVRIVRCLDDGEALIELNGKAASVRFNRSTGECLEGKQLHMVANPGFISVLDSRSGDACVDGNAIEARVVDHYDELTDVVVVAVLNGVAVKLRISKAEWLKLRKNISDKLILCIPEDHLHLVSFEK